MGRTTLTTSTTLTVELRDLIENGVDIWDFEYDGFYEGDDKIAFEKKVIDHYYFRQIGQETVERFKHFFRCRIREIMPYYKQVYKSIKIMDEIEDPFGNVDITETTTENTKTNTSSNGTLTGNNSNTHKYLDSPHGSIENLDSYLTEATTDNGNTSSTSVGSGEGKTDRTLTYTKKGNQGVNTYAHDMVEYRQTFLNIDKMIIDDLNNLFLGVY